MGDGLSQALIRIQKLKIKLLIMNKVSISILDCDFDNLEFEINRINKR